MKLIMIGLSILLIGVAVSNGSAYAQCPSPITFTDDFEDGDAFDWSPQTASRWQVSSDAGSLRYFLNTTNYEPTGAGVGELSLIRGRKWADFKFECSAKSADAIGGVGAADLCIIFGYQNSGSYYYINFNGSEGLTQLFRVHDGGVTVLDTHSPPTFADANYHTLRVERTGSQIRAFFDGSQILSATDSFFGEGQIGVGSFNDSGYFDNVSVTGCPALAELVADRVYLRTGPGSGAEVPNPVAGQQYYIHFDWRNIGTAAANNFRLEIKLNNNVVCGYTTTANPQSSTQQAWCTSPVTWPVGNNTIQGVLDVNDVVVELDENNNAVSQTLGPFVDISAGLTGVSNSTVSWADFINNDGKLDVLLIGQDNTREVTKLYKNEGTYFTDISGEAALIGVKDGSAAWGDYDNDEDVDLLLTGDATSSGLPRVTRIYRYESLGRFTLINAGLPGVRNGAGVWGDYDNDGDLDILLTGSSAPGVNITKIYKNDKGSFSEAVNLPGVAGGSAVAWGDYDNDGDLDILLAGQESSGNSVAVVYQNTNGNFTDIRANLTGVSASAVAWGDYDSDGDLDILLAGRTNSGSRITKIYQNNNNSFTDINAALPGVESGSVAFGDYDNDGDLDILLTGDSNTGPIAKVYRNNNNVSFSEADAVLNGVKSSSAAWGDYDNDSDLDILLAGLTQSNSRLSIVYRSGTGTSNTLPNTPVPLTPVFSGGATTLRWNKSTDTQTAQNALTYNVRLGTTPGKVDIVSPMSNLASGFRRVPKIGNAGHPNSFIIRNLSPGTTYYWSVQAVDNAFAGSAFASEQSFTVPTTPIPSVSSISPTSGNRLQTLDVVFTGTNFISTSTVNVGPGINVMSTTMTSSTSLTARIEITAAAATGTRNFSVSNGNVTSNSQTFTVNNPLPTLTAINPSSGAVGKTIDVVFTGTNFIDGATTVNAGAGITVNSVKITAPTSLTVNLSITASAATGARNFSVANPSPGGGTSSSLPFSVTNLTLGSITPNTGSRLQRLNVVFSGTNFASGVSSVNVGTGITINAVTVNNATSLTADLTIAAAAETGAREFSVTNSGQDGGTSNSVTFTVTNPLPTLTSISPANGNRLQTLEVVFTGTNFLSDASSVNVGPGINFKSASVTSSTSLTASLEITAAAATGTRSFSITNSAPGGGASAVQNFTVGNPAPALISINPSNGVIGQTLDVIFTGTNFFSDATSLSSVPGITINSFNVINATSLTANITITSTATAGPKNFSVVNSAPGGGTSGTQIFMVNNPLPTLASIAPASGNRLQTLDVVFTGKDFINGVSSVDVGAGINILSTTVTDAASLTARLTITEAAVTGQRNFSVVNSSPGGGSSASRSFTVNNPAPTLASINPTIGGLGQTLDVVFTGMNFISGVTSVNVGNGVTVVSTTVSNSTSLTAKISIAATAAAGARIFSVTNTGPGGGTSSSQTFTISSNRAPDIIHTPLSPQPEKQDIIIQANITDDSAAPSAMLNYRAGGELIFTPVTMSSTGSTYRGTIPGSAVDSRGVEYFILATDGNLTTRAPLSGSYLILVQIMNAVKPSPQPGGSEENAYRLISVPIQATNASATAILEDDLGTYANTKWRLFGLVSVRPTSDKQPYVEVSQSGTFTPGRTFFLIVKEAGKTIDSDAGQSIRTDQEFAIPLEIGHNFVAAPFNFTIPLSKLRLKSGGIINLRTYQGNWITANDLTPWEGYYLPNNQTTVDTLFVNANLSSSLPVSKKDDNGWRVQILASCDQARDTENFAGLAPESADGYDDNDLAEPPPIGEYVSVCFPHPEWQKPLSRFSDDMRSASNPNQKWRFVVESNITNEMVTLRFDGLQEIDANSAVFLVDEALSYKQNLRENAVYQYQPRRHEVTKAFILIVGKEEFISEQTANAQGAPENFVLEQNFPNPFNPETAVRFGLPQQSIVTIKIFDLAGHEVVTLLDRVELPAGRHQRVWDGRDALGRTVGSGIYFCRLTAGGFAKTVKLTVMR